MWRLIVLTIPLFLMGSATAAAQTQGSPGDVDCAPCGQQCQDADGASGDQNCSPPATDGHFFGVEVFGLGPLFPPPSFHEEHRDDTQRFELTEADDQVDPLTGESSRKLRVYEADVPRRGAIDDEMPVLRIHDGAPPEMMASDDEDIPVIRIHEDDPDSAGDDETRIEINAPDDQDLNEEQVDEQPPEFVTGYVEWEFIPVIQILHASGAVTDIDVQRTLQDDQDEIAACFQPRTYPGGGSVDVDVHLAYNGVVQAVNGTTDGVPPLQARCILQRAWRYQFPRVAEDADQKSHLGYRVEFVGQRLDAPDVEPGQAQLLLERVTADRESLREAIADSMVDHLDSAEQCAAEGLSDMPTDFVATGVDARFRHAENGRYTSTDLDITVTNKTSSQLPSQNVVDCYERALRQWEFHLDDVEPGELPDVLDVGFYVTVRPPGWYGM